MFDKISAIILALLMFLVFFGSASNLLVFIPATVVLIAAATAINIKRIGWAWSHLLLPAFFLLASAAVFSIMTGPAVRVVFLAAASILFFMLEFELGKESHFLQNLYLLTAFGIYLGIFAFQFYFHLNVYLTSLIAFFFTYALIVLGFAGFSLPKKKYFYLIISLVVAELGWGVVLWPTHFFVNAVVIFCAFYLLWLFGFSIFFGRLSTKKIYWQLTLVGLVLLVTLLSAAWKPLAG